MEELYHEPVALVSGLLLMRFYWNPATLFLYLQSVAASCRAGLLRKSPWFVKLKRFTA